MFNQLKKIDFYHQNKQKFLVVFYFLIILISFYIINIQNLKNFSYTFLIYLLFLLIKNKCGRIRNSVFLVFNFILGIELFFSIKYGYISESLLKSALENDSEQSVTMILQELFPIIIPAVLFSIIFTFTIYNKIQLNLNNKFLYWGTIFICCFFFFKNTFYYYLSDKRHVRDFQIDPFFSLNKSIRMKYPMVIGNTSILLTSYFGFKEKYTNVIEHERYNQSIINNKSMLYGKYKNIILILGESAYRGRHSIYGYEKNTTPNMSKIFSQKNSCVIEQAHSPASITRDSIPMLLSFAKPNNELPLLEEKNIIEMANIQKYHTSWISKTRESGAHSSKYSIIAKLSNTFIENLEDDLQLQEKLIETNFQKNENNFIVLHLAGSHKPYNLGYDQLDSQDLPNGDKYDLTIHHTDRVIEKIYNTLKVNLDNFILIYTPDHGEIVDLGHGLLRKSKNFSNQFEVPLMIYSTYDDFPCKEIENYRNNDKMINTSNIVYLFSKLLGYSVDIDQSLIINDLILSVDGQPYEYQSFIKKYQ